MIDSAVCSEITCDEREFFSDDLLVRIHFIIVKVRWTGLAPWEFEFAERQARAEQREGVLTHLRALGP